MKKILFLAAILLSIQCLAQETIKESKTIYLNVIEKGNLFNKKKKILFEFGDFQNDLEKKLLYDKKGKPINFNFAVDAMNHFNSFGWELKSTMAVFVRTNNDIFYYYTMEKTVYR